MTVLTYRVCVCEYAYNGQHGTPQIYDFTGKSARARAIGMAFSELVRSSVTSVRVVRMSIGQNFSTGFSVMNVRNPNPVKPTAGV